MPVFICFYILTYLEQKLSTKISTPLSTLENKEKAMNLKIHLHLRFRFAKLGMTKWFSGCIIWADSLKNSIIPETEKY